MDVWDGCIKTFKKSNMRFLIFIVLMLGITGIAWAQMTDAQVVEAVKSAQAQGKSQDEIILMLSAASWNTPNMAMMGSREVAISLM